MGPRKTDIFVLHQMKRGLKRLIRLSGKSDRKVVAVFGPDPASCDSLVRHVRQGSRGIPIWLFTTSVPAEETSALCERVLVERGSLALLLRAERDLWACWVALTAGAWNGRHGQWPLKLAPLVVPPFRGVLLNRHGDFFPASRAAIARYLRHSLREALDFGWQRATDFWALATAHAWRSAPVTRSKDVAVAVALGAASSLLKWCGYPQRRVFGLLDGGGRLRLAVPQVCGPESGDGIDVFPAPAEWNAARFDQFVRASTGRWLLWRQDGEPAPDCDALLRLAADPGTFAVSLQTHHRGWKPCLMPMAPFRRLQPGEHSRLLAPLAGTMLVDRRKLLALGIPSCSLAGTTWLTLFWKAAAAGWSSYSLGSESGSAQLPDLPMEETACAARILTSRRLRRLGPRDGALARGTIATRHALPASAEPTDGRPKVLLVTPFLPYPLAHGGAVRIYNLCRALSGRVDFVLAAIREQGEFVDYPKLQEVFRQVYVVDMDEAASGGRGLPRQVRHHQSRSLRALIAHLAGTFQPDLLQIEYTHLAHFRDAAPQLPAILVEHDITFQLYRQLLESQPGREARREYERWRAYESHWLRAVDGVWTVSEEDRRAAIAEGARPSAVFAVPNGVDIARFVPRREPPASPLDAAPEILYVGSFRHLPNILGFENLRRGVMPLVWQRFPEARLRVVAGPEHESFWKRFAPAGALAGLDPRIRVHGFVSDLRPLYAEATAAAIPLAVSAGTNIKVLEAMACGKAIVTTPVGCAGLGLTDGREALIRTGPAEFAAGLCEVLASPSLRERLAGAARDTAERRYSWSAIATEAERSYRALVQQAPRALAASPTLAAAVAGALPDLPF
ncbi:MAG: glycosyltransferase family 4 protein [Bryobacteraceae bacterium]